MRLNNVKEDAFSGFLVFLIALPLCLGISLACGYPAVAGIFTAIVGGMIATFLSDSQLTIKGPAAGLIVIAIGCITEFGFTGQNAIADHQAYRLALGVGVAAGVIQIVLGLMRAGILGDFFPSAAIHGMLAAIGIIIIAKQLPIVLGVAAKGEALELLREIPNHVRHLNPEVALIGVVSLLILFLLPLAKSKTLKRIPGPMLVILTSIPLGIAFDLPHEHTYSWARHSYKVGEYFLVSVPASLWSAVTFPDFSGLLNPRAWAWVGMFAIIGSLESILSAKAIDAIDPLKRKTNLSRDLFSIGVGNTLCAFIGGLPMISEIVRSRANLDNGAQSRLSNFFHGLFLLLALTLLPSLIHRIPLAALAAMLVYTGFRLAHPREFVHVYKIGFEQFLVFSGTVMGVLATDLLVGILIGIVLELTLHVLHGMPPVALFRAPEFQRNNDTVTLTPRGAAVFTNWLIIRRAIQKEGLEHNHNVVVDLSKTRFVDHTTIAKLHEIRREFQALGLELRIEGLDAHQSLSKHPLSALKRRAVSA